jgi:hypothetical protein
MIEQLRVISFNNELSTVPFSHNPKNNEEKWKKSIYFIHFLHEKRKK